MTKEQIERAYKKNAELSPEEIQQITNQVAQTKRFIELVSMIPEAEELAGNDPNQFHEKYGLHEIDTKEMAYLYDVEKAKELEALDEKAAFALIPESVFRYKQFLSNKLHHRDQLRETLCVPSNSSLKKWRKRQLERCKGAAGPSYEANIHIPFNLELTEGCSVGCPFCAVGARKLQKIFRYTDENAKLYREVLAVAHEVIGNAAGAGGLYYSSEPLDNPDYELFVEDYYTEFNQYPQITTAIALRDPERMHKLLARLQQVPSTIYRFSMFSVEDTLKVMQEFTSQELLRVELLPQYEEAPAFIGFAKSGRELQNDRETKENIFNSICCVSGFVVNMANQTVRLITSINADEKHPTGEVIYGQCNFQNAEEFKQILLEMIEQYIPVSIPEDQPLSLYPYYKLVEDKEHGACIQSASGSLYSIEKMIYPGAKALVTALQEGKRTKSELAEYLYDHDEVKPEHTYWLLTALWKMGVINEFF